MIKCPECGYEMDGNYLNCPNCGCPFTEWAENSSTSPLHKREDDASHRIVRKSSISNNQRKERSKYIAVPIILSIIAICLIVICISFLWKAKKGNEETEQASRYTDQIENSTTGLENNNLAETENSLTHTETVYEGIEEQRSDHDGTTVYWFMPSGFAKAEDGLYYAPGYPDDTANINVMEAQDDQVTFQYTKDSFCDTIEYMYMQSYGYEVDVNCTEFTKSTLNGYNTLLIRASYTLLGMDIEQIQFAVEVGRDKVTTITYTQQVGGSWTDAFNYCIASVRIDKNSQESNDGGLEVVRSEAEITFKDIPWGTTFSEVDSTLSQLRLWNITGEDFKQYSVDDILIGDYKGIDFEYSGINVISMAMNGEQGVAGYTTSGIELYFAYVPVNGYLTYNEDDSVLYGAQYKFEPTDLELMYSDLVQKISGIYGDPYNTTEDYGILGSRYTYTFWYGKNDTELVLRAEDNSNNALDLPNEIYISYAWRYGDTLLQNASDAVKKEKLDAEIDAQESGNTDGL